MCGVVHQHVRCLCVWSSASACEVFVCGVVHQHVRCLCVWSSASACEVFVCVE